MESGNLKIKRFLASEIYYYDKDRKIGGDIQAMIIKDADPLLMELKPLAVTEEAGFKPYFIIDSLTDIYLSITDYLKK